MACSMAQSVKAASISDLERERDELERQREEAQRQQDEQRRQLSGISGQISSLEGNADEVAGEIEEMDAALVETIASVEIIEEEIEEKEEQIEITTQEYEQAKATEEAQYEAMKLRIRFMYEKGDATYLQLILESHSIGEMMNKADYISQLYEYDRKMLQAYQEAREATLAIKEQLEDERSELEAQQHELEEEKESLEIMLAEKQRVYDNYEVQIAQARQEAAIYKANIKKQTDNIRKLQAAASAKESEIEAAKRGRGKKSSGGGTAKTGGGRSRTAERRFRLLIGGLCGGKWFLRRLGKLRQFRQLRQLCFGVQLLGFRQQGPADCELCLPVYRESLRAGRHQPDPGCGLLRIRVESLQGLRIHGAKDVLRVPECGKRGILFGSPAGRYRVLCRTCGSLHRKRADRACQYPEERHQDHHGNVQGDINSQKNCVNAPGHLPVLLSV